VNTAAEVMTALTSHDVKVVVEGDRVRLLLSADRPPPKALIEAARFHKQALRTILGKLVPQARMVTFSPRCGPSART
jgi:hypothetical protein